MSGGKKVMINSNSFVGFSARSKSGCTACRKRKKKCDEIHPICGPCTAKKTTCEWKIFNNKKDKYFFDVKPMMESQKLMELERSNTGIIKSSNNSVYDTSSTGTTTTQNIINSSQPIKTKQRIEASSGKVKKNKKENIENMNLRSFTTDGPTRNQGKTRLLINNLDNDSVKSFSQSTIEALNPSALQKKIEEQSQSLPLDPFIDPSINTTDVDRAVNELLGNDILMDGFISNVVQHIKSPKFNPVMNFLDLSINSALKQFHTLCTYSKQRSSTYVENGKADNNNNISILNNSSPVLSFSPFEQFINLHNTPRLDDEIEKLDINHTENELIELSEIKLKDEIGDSPLIETAKAEEIDQGTIDHNKNVEFADQDDGTNYTINDDEEDFDEDYDGELDKYHPMDESQLLENLYISDSDLIKVFKSKQLHPYLRPTVHLLLSKNNALKIISPSSPIMRQLDSTGKLFLENYVTNLAMNQLDIGNNQFFLDFALSQANTDPAILYCLVAWGGMFLVGRENEEAIKYFDKGIKLVESKRKLMKNLKSKDNNEERIRLLLFYVLFACAEISTGDVNRWFQMLLQCKDILSNYGSLTQFIHENKNSKVANWILSNIFYHDVLCTRALDFGTVFSIHEYKDVFKSQKHLARGDYGLDPFYGLSQNLYILLGEVANNRRIMKNLKFPLNFIPVDGLAKEMNEKYYRDTEESWFQIFDVQILNCKPPSDMLDLLIKEDPAGKLLEHHLTWYELTQISLRIYIRINFKEIEFDDQEIQTLRHSGVKLFNILVGTKLQTLLGLSLLMLGITSIDEMQRESLKEIYDKFLKNYQILNVQVCWEIIKQVWRKYDNQVAKNDKHYIDWSEVVNAMGWNCCFT